MSFGIIFILIVNDYHFWSNFHSNSIFYEFRPNFHSNTMNYVFCLIFILIIIFILILYTDFLSNFEANSIN